MRGSPFHINVGIVGDFDEEDDQEEQNVFARLQKREREKAEAEEAERARAQSEVEAEQERAAEEEARIEEQEKRERKGILVDRRAELERKMSDASAGTCFLIIVICLSSSLPIYVGNEQCIGSCAATSRRTEQSKIAENTPCIEHDQGCRAV